MGAEQGRMSIYFVLRILHLLGDPFILSLLNIWEHWYLKLSSLCWLPPFCVGRLWRRRQCSFYTEKSSFLAVSKCCVFHSWTQKWVGFWTFFLSLHLLFGRWYHSLDPAEQPGRAVAPVCPLHRKWCEGSWRLHHLLGACPGWGVDMDTKNRKCRFWIVTQWWVSAVAEPTESMELPFLCFRRPFWVCTHKFTLFSAFELEFVELLGWREGSQSWLIRKGGWRMLILYAVVLKYL